MIKFKITVLIYTLLGAVYCFSQGLIFSSTQGTTVIVIEKLSDGFSQDTIFVPTEKSEDPITTIRELYNLGLYPREGDTCHHKIISKTLVDCDHCNIYQCEQCKFIWGERESPPLVIWHNGRWQKILTK